MLREVSLGVERPLIGGDELAKDRAVREVGMDALLRICVRFRASMLLLVTRLSNCSARSSVDSFSSWIILKENKVFHPAPLFFLMSTTCNFLAHYGEIDKRMKTLP